MSKKQLILIISLLTIPLIVLLTGVIAVYKLHPELLGLSPYGEESLRQTDSIENSKDNSSGSAKNESKSEIHGSNFDSLFTKLVYIDNYQNKKERIIEENRSLKDSISKLDSHLTSIQDSLSKQISENLSSLSLLAKLGDSLAATKARLNYKINNYSTAKDKKNDRQPSNIQKNIDSIMNHNINELSQIFNNTDPDKAARILENTSPTLAFKILKTMNKKKAGKIIDAIRPKYGASILSIEVGN